MNATSRIALNLSFTLFGGAVTFFRFYIRYITNRRPKQVAYLVCDGFVAVALITTVVFTACDVWLQIEKARRGVTVGTRTSLPLDLKTTIMKATFASYFIYLFSLWSVKAAFLSTYFVVASPLRLSSPRLYRWLIVAAVSTGVSILVCVLYVLGSCQPVSRNWVMGTEHCLNHIGKEYIIITVCMKVTTDITTVILGFFVISTATRLHRGEKAGILLIFILGLVTIIAAIVRFSLQYAVHKKVDKEGITGTSGWDIVHSARTEMFLMVSSVAEMNVALVAVSVPPFRVFLRRGGGRGNPTGRTSPTGGLLESHDAWGRSCSTGTTQGYSQPRGKSDLEELQEMVMRPVTPELVLFEEDGNGSGRYGEGLPSVRLTEPRR